MFKQYPHKVTRENIPGAEFGFDDIGVYRDGQLVRSFNSLSNNYAMTAANEFALDLVRRIEDGQA